MYVEFEAFEQMIRQQLSPKRWQHTQHCIIYTEELAGQFKLDAKQAHLAALLHDAFRDRSDDELLCMAKDYDVEPSESERCYPVLLHGPLAALWAEHKLQIHNAQVLEAIRYHTTGVAHMGNLATLLYIADSLEPGRSYPEADRLRQLVRESSLEESALLVIEQSLRYQLDKREPIAEETIRWRNQLIYDNLLEEPKAKSGRSGYASRCDTPSAAALSMHSLT